MGFNFHLMGAPTTTIKTDHCFLAAPTSRTAAHAAIATAVADHDGATG